MDTKKRIASHLSSIKNFSLYNPQSYLCVAAHFNMKEHYYMQHFSFFILITDLENATEGLNYEAFFINLFKQLNVNLRNDIIPKL